MTIWLTAFFKSLEIIKSITGAEQVNTTSWCIGGTLLATGLAVLHEKQQQSSVASATYFTSMFDFSEPGDLGVFLDENQQAQRELQLKDTGILSGKDLALAFSMIRANDLIWSYVVNNYLKGQAPTPFDILYWNSDSTNLPVNMYTYYIRNMYLENNLIKPNALTMCGVPIDLSHLKTPSYFLSTIDDHIAPWQTTFSGTQLLSGPTEFVLGASGHIAGVINPPAKKKRSYWINGEFGQGAAHWLETAQSQPGSWWPHWNEWLKKQGGSEKSDFSKKSDFYDAKYQLSSFFTHHKSKKEALCLNLKDKSGLLKTTMMSILSAPLNESKRKLKPLMKKGATYGSMKISCCGNIQVPLPI